MKTKKIIVWFRFDLRIADNPALHAAAAQGQVIPVYILDQDDTSDFNIGESSAWWLDQSLRSLSESLNNRLQVFQGNPIKVLQKIIKQTGAYSVYWNDYYQPLSTNQDIKIKETLTQLGITVEHFNGHLLWEPTKIVKSDGTPYKVFTKFFQNGCLKAEPPRQTISKPSKLSLYPDNLGIAIDDLKLSNQATQTKLSQHWQPGEKHAMLRLKHFIHHGLADYKENRNIPSLDGTSKLSAHLHFGEISTVQIWNLIQDQGHDFANRENIKTFLTELGWREFTHNVLFFNPEMPRKNLQPKFNKISWHENQKHLTAWQEGKTGYPIIDAAMRELYHTGFMHNRMRMVTASFLIKNLLIHWHKGEDWFWNLLVDADLASNSFNWQWVAGSGYDATPYFRIFNPILQAKKFDPKAEYIKKWIPELLNLPLKYIFEPYNAPDDILKKSGVALGKTYPHPIIDLKTSSKKTLDLFKKSFQKT